MTCLLLKDLKDSPPLGICVPTDVGLEGSALSCPRCIPALLLVSARYPALLYYSPWECVVCRLPNVGLFICSALVLALADFPMVLAFG